MLIFLRWLLTAVKKEHAVLERYERSHLHFFWFLALDAVLTVALVIGGYQLFLTNTPATETGEPLEVSVISSSALTSLARAENMDAFWLGPVAGYKYTLNDQVVRIVDIFYWSGETGNRNAKQFLYEVKTYESQDVWNAHTHPIRANANTTTIAVNEIISIKINKSSMMGVIATFADKPEIVAIAYPKAQTLDSMINNVESLKLVR